MMANIISKKKNIEVKPLQMCVGLAEENSILTKEEVMKIG
jgi:hypothetical protein